MYQVSLGTFTSFAQDSNPLLCLLIKRHAEPKVVGWKDSETTEGLQQWFFTKQAKKKSTWQVDLDDNSLLTLGKQNAINMYVW